MQRLLSTLWDRRAKLAKADKGFTLIELLVVVVILGVLIAIAIPLYLNYRKGANDAAAQSDLKNAISTLEQCNSSSPGYPTADFLLPGSTSNAAGTCTQLINISGGTSKQYKASATAGVSYVVVDTNSSGSGKFYCYNSSRGGQVASITAPTGGVVTAATLTSC